MRPKTKPRIGSVKKQSILTKRLAILFLCTVASLFNMALAQPVVNERYEIDGAPSSIFGSVVSTDSCYYVAGIHVSHPSVYETKSSFIKMNFDGTINQFTSIENDTIGIDFWLGYNMITTLDGNLAIMANAYADGYENAFMFFKITPNGEVITSNFIYDFYSEREEFGIRPYTLLQDSDSSYYGVASIQRESDLRGGTVFYKLDKNGNLLFSKSFFPPEHLGYNILKSGSLVKENDTVFVIGSTQIDNIEFETEDRRFHSKLIRVDKEGNFLNSYTYTQDTVCPDVNSLIKTADNGYLYCGRNGKFFKADNLHGYKGRIVKLNSDFQVDWTLTLGNYAGDPYLDLTKIMALNDTEFVATGYSTDYIRKPEPRLSQYGWLIKFNIQGDLIWERKYQKVPHYVGEANNPSHELYDVELTPDNGFVMVGQAVNYHVNESPIGQMAWVVKTDKFGCIVPRCQLNDTPLETLNDSEVVVPPKVNPPKENPITWLYPNPTGNSLFYYHRQADFKGGTAYIYNSAGQMVQKWEITENDITYEVDVSQLAAGSYILKVFNMFGEVIETEQFVKN